MNDAIITGFVSETKGQQLLGRRVSLAVFQSTTGSNPIGSNSNMVGGALGRYDSVLDLSQMHFRFSCANQDEEGPDNCLVRVYNLAPETVKKLLKAPISHLVLQVGYGDQFGIIFEGDVKQYRVGRENATDTYVDILSADGDFGYNRSTIATTLSRVQNTRAGQLRAINDAMSPNGVTVSPEQFQETQVGGIVEGFRGKTMIGMARAQMRVLAQTELSTWTIQDGRIRITPLKGYSEGEAVVLTQATGLIGYPEATQDGVKARCLINPKIQIGGRVRIDNASINKTVTGQKLQVPGVQLSYNQWAGVQNFANTGYDGFYRVYVAESTGDTRGDEWYTDLTLLLIDNSSDNVVGNT